MTATLPANLENQVIRYWGASGRHWLHLLPARLADLQAAFQIIDMEPASKVGLHWIGHGLKPFQGKQIPVTLKLGLPDMEFEHETQALLRMQTHPQMVRLLAASPEQGWQLMERILPGTDLTALKSDAESTEIWLTELKLLPATQSDRQYFPDARKWCQALWQSPASSLLTAEGEIARKLCRDLILSERDVFLLHGDLHHQNVLQNAQGGWTVIDPKGMIAGPEFELGAMLRNPFPDWSRHPQLADLLQARLKRIACDSRFQIDRVMRWAYVQAVLAACWSLDEQEIRLWLKVAQAFEGLI